MGGNVKVKGVQARKIPVKKIGRAKFRKDFLELFETLNKLYEKEYDVPLWVNKKDLESGFLFNGSTTLFFDPNIPDNPLLDLKPTSGDIDIIVPEDTKEKLWHLLKKYEDKFITKKIKYIGNNKPTVSSIGEQINALFEYHGSNEPIYAQVDFEFLEYEDNKPTEWAKFSHSSTFDDLQANIKAVFHKYLIRSIARAVGKKPNVILVTSKADCENWEKKIKKKQDDGFVKFSVSRGIRIAYRPLICDGVHIEKDGKKVYQELKTSDSEYVTTIADIFEILFGIEPTGSEKEKFWSFVGVLSLMKKHMSKDLVKDTFERFVQLLWESKVNRNIGQELERGNPELDYEIKYNAYKKFLNEFPYLKSVKVQPMINKYYDNYGIREASLFMKALSRLNGSKL